MQNRNIYTVKEGKSKDTKFRGLKDANEDIYIAGNRVKRYKAEQSQKIQRNPSP